MSINILVLKNVDSTRRILFHTLKKALPFIQTKYFNDFNINDEETAERLKDIKHVFDLKDPGQFFSEARLMNREIIFHAGPTNSGKTYHAIQRYLQANTGIYCGPLRMLAGEIFRRTNEQGVPCDLITGEERLWADTEENPSNHVACTVELCSTVHHYDVAVIDEIQMLRDFERGWAWTRALLGVPAREVHICGEEAAIDIVKKLLAKTNEKLEVKKYDRLTPLKALKSSIDIYNLQKGDCVVAFSQKNIYESRQMIEKLTGLKSAVIYGNLPANVRFDQARQFNDGLCDVLVASDAIGMGLNLNIRRIVFSSLMKFDGIEFGTLEAYHLKQIAGRAGRYGSKYEYGLVSAKEPKMMSTLHKLMQVPIKPISKAGISPTFEQLELLSMAIPGKTLYELLDIFELLMELDRNYFLCDVERVKMVAEEIQDIPLSLYQSYLFSIAPMNIIKSPLVRLVMKQFAWSVSLSTPVTLANMKKFVNWPPKSFPKTVKQLQHLEYIHESFDLYRWLSYRFTDIFVDLDGIIALQEKLEKTISRAVDANLKHYDNDLQRFVAKRKKRKFK